MRVKFFPPEYEIKSQSNKSVFSNLGFSHSEPKLIQEIFQDQDFSDGLFVKHYWPAASSLNGMKYHLDNSLDRNPDLEYLCYFEENTDLKLHDCQWCKTPHMIC